MYMAILTFWYSIINLYYIILYLFLITGMYSFAAKDTLFLSLISCHVLITSQMQCFDTLCWSSDRRINISCDHSNYHCMIDHFGNLSCLPGSVDVGIRCNTSDKYFQCQCSHDNYGVASCNCFNAYMFWTVIAAMSIMFLFTQICLICHYFKNSYSRQTAITFREEGRTATNRGVSDLNEPLLPPEPGEPQFRPDAPPPSYNDVANNCLSNPATNPYFDPLS